MQELQRKLSQDNIRAFYHDNFVDRQVSDFILLLGPSFKLPSANVVDVGGGCGFFAKALQNRTNANVRVIDTDFQSIAFCKQAGINAAFGDALCPQVVGDENIICFNLILHHLIGASERETYQLQKRALSAWHSTARAIFINEYVYESFIPGVAGWLIFQVTRNWLLSQIGRFIARFVPSLRANTFGVGVRFRSHAEWCQMFSSAGFEVINTAIDRENYVSLPRRILMIRSCRRESFLLKPRQPQHIAAVGEVTS